MPPQPDPPATFRERLIGASLGTLAMAYVIFLVLDLLFRWGLGWVVLGWAAIGVIFVTAIIIFISLWVWVYKGSGRYQMRNGKN